MFCYCSVCDDNYVPHFAALLASVADHGPRAPYYLISDGVSAENRERLREFAAGLDMQLIIIDGTISGRAGLKTNLHFSMAVWLKIFAPQFLPEEYDRVVILDCDMIVVSNLSELMEMDLGNAAIWCAPDGSGDHTERKKRIGAPDEATYVNAGLVVNNLREWRRGGYSKKIKQFALANADKLDYVEQCAINAVMWDRIELLERKWNFLVLLDEVPVPDPKILHFANTKKPWNSRFVPGCEFYRHYRDMTPWAIPDLPKGPPDRWDYAQRFVKRMRRTLMKHLGAEEYAHKLAHQLIYDRRIRDMSALYRDYQRGRRAQRATGA
jgi:lipopolysaccharide biosynthesis glycosyltransferase